MLMIISFLCGLLGNTAASPSACFMPRTKQQPKQMTKGEIVLKRSLKSKQVNTDASNLKGITGKSNLRRISKSQ